MEMQSNSSPSPSPSSGASKETVAYTSFIPFNLPERAPPEPSLSLSLDRPDAYNVNTMRSHRDDQQRNLLSNPMPKSYQMQEDFQAVTTYRMINSEMESYRLREESGAGLYGVRESVADSFCVGKEVKLGSFPTRESDAVNDRMGDESADVVGSFQILRESDAVNDRMGDESAEAVGSFQTRESEMRSYHLIQEYPEVESAASIRIRESLDLLQHHFQQKEEEEEEEVTKQVLQHEVTGAKKPLRETESVNQLFFPRTQIHVNPPYPSFHPIEHAHQPFNNPLGHFNQFPYGLGQSGSSKKSIGHANQPFAHTEDAKKIAHRHTYKQEDQNPKPSFGSDIDRIRSMHQRSISDISVCNNLEYDTKQPSEPMYEPMSVVDQTTHMSSRYDLGHHPDLSLNHEENYEEEEEEPAAHDRCYAVEQGHGLGYGSHNEDALQKLEEHPRYGVLFQKQEPPPAHDLCYGIEQGHGPGYSSCNQDTLQKFEEHPGNGVLFQKLREKEPIYGRGLALTDTFSTEPEGPDHLSDNFNDGDIRKNGNIVQKEGIIKKKDLSKYVHRGEHVEIMKDGEEGNSDSDISKVGDIISNINGDGDINKHGNIPQDKDLKYDQEDSNIPQDKDLKYDQEDSKPDVVITESGQLDAGIHLQTIPSELMDNDNMDILSDQLPDSALHDRTSEQSDDIVLPQSGTPDDVTCLRTGTSEDIMCLQRGTPDDILCPQNDLQSASSFQTDLQHIPSDDLMPIQGTPSDDVAPSDDVMPIQGTPSDDITPSDDVMPIQGTPSDDITPSDDVMPIQGTLSDDITPSDDVMPIQGTPSDDISPSNVTASDVSRNHGSSSDDANHVLGSPSNDAAHILGVPSDDGPWIQGGTSNDVMCLQSCHTNVVTHIQNGPCNKIEEGKIQVQTDLSGVSGLPPLPHDGVALSQQCYPAPLAPHEAVIKDRELFMTTLSDFLASLGARLTVPKLGERELDLYELYCQVTSRGGLEQVISSGRWKEVAEALGISSSLLSASFILRKHYMSHLFQYEKVYYFRAEGKMLMEQPVPLPAPSPVEPHEDAGSPYEAPPEIAASLRKRKKKLNPLHVFGVDPAASIGTMVTGAIRGKFEDGYLITVVVGTEKLSGVLYHIPTEKNPQQYATIPSLRDGIGSEGNPNGLEIQVYGRKRKDYVRKKDPNAPKRTRTGYNIFFKEQRARLKQLYPESKGHGKTVIEMWNKLPENDKALYVARGNEEREKYLEEYRERMRLQSETPPDNLPENNTEAAIGDDDDDDDDVDDDEHVRSFDSTHQHVPYDATHDYHVSLEVETNLHEDHGNTSERDSVVYRESHENEPQPPGPLEPEMSGRHLVSREEALYEVHEDGVDQSGSEDDDDGKEAEMEEDEDAYEDEGEEETIYPPPSKQVLQKAVFFEQENVNTFGSNPSNAISTHSSSSSLEHVHSLAYVPTMPPKQAEVSTESAVMQPPPLEHVYQQNISKVGYRFLLNGDDNMMDTCDTMTVHEQQSGLGSSDGSGYLFLNAGNTLCLSLPPREQEQASTHSRQEEGASCSTSTYNLTPLHRNQTFGIQAQYGYPLDMPMYSHTTTHGYRPHFPQFPYPLPMPVSSVTSHPLFGNTCITTTPTQALQHHQHFSTLDVRDGGAGPLIGYKVQDDDYNPIASFKNSGVQE